MKFCYFKEKHEIHAKLTLQLYGYKKYEWLQINIDIYVLCLEGSLEYHVVYQYTVFTLYFPCKNRVFSILQKQNRSPGRLTRMSRGS